MNISLHKYPIHVDNTESTLTSMKYDLSLSSDITLFLSSLSEIGISVLEIESASTFNRTVNEQLMGISIDFGESKEEVIALIKYHQALELIPSEVLAIQQKILSLEGENTTLKDEVAGLRQVIDTMLSGGASQ